MKVLSTFSFWLVATIVLYVSTPFLFRYDSGVLRVLGGVLEAVYTLLIYHEMFAMPDLAEVIGSMSWIGTGYVVLTLTALLITMALGPYRVIQWAERTLRRYAATQTVQPDAYDFFRTPFFVIPLVFIATWASAIHVYERWFEPWGSVVGLVILAGAVALWVFLYMQRPAGSRPVSTPSWALILIGGLLLLHGILYARVPRLVTCEIAAAALGIALIGSLPAGIRGRSWGLVFLIMLSMHVATSLDFFVGFPLRMISAKFADLLLGPIAFSSGTGLTDGSTVFYVDGPCSGVRMLSTGLALAAVVAVILQFSFVRTIALLMLSTALTVFGNAQRAAALFLVGGGGEEEAHTGFGLIVFIECAIVLLALAVWMKKRERPPAIVARHMPSLPPTMMRWAMIVPAAIAAVGPAFVTPAQPASIVAYSGLEWPATWRGLQLVPVALDPEVSAFLQTFPGKWAQFQVQHTDEFVLLRLCEGATRKLHSAENCYVAQGGRCETMDAIEDETGHVWSRFRYHGESRSQTVRQCYFAVDPAKPAADLDDWITGAPSWPDVSSWYWNAALPGSNVHYTLAVTVAVPS